MTQEELKLVLDALENGDVPTPENVGKNLDAITAIKEALAQRTWVGLAAEDRLTAKYMQDAPEGIEAVIDYIEAKLKEKNSA
jgi:hypothetical protein